MTVLSQWEETGDFRSDISIPCTYQVSSRVPISHSLYKKSNSHAWAIQEYHRNLLIVWFHHKGPFTYSHIIHIFSYLRDRWRDSIVSAKIRWNTEHVLKNVVLFRNYISNSSLTPSVGWWCLKCEPSLLLSFYRIFDPKLTSDFPHSERPIN